MKEDFAAKARLEQQPAKVDEGWGDPKSASTLAAEIFTFSLFRTLLGTLNRSPLLCSRRETESIDWSQEMFF